MKRASKALTIFALLALLAAQTACTANQIDEAIADLQIGVDAASIAAPLVLSAYAPMIAAPVTAYLAMADQIFADVAKLATNSQLSSQQKAASIASSIAALVAQNPSQFLPTNSPPQVVAEVMAVANAARAVASLFPSTAMASRAAHATLTVPVRSMNMRLSSAQTARLAALQVQARAQANQVTLAAQR